PWLLRRTFLGGIHQLGHGRVGLCIRRWLPRHRRMRRQYRNFHGDKPRASGVGKPDRKLGPAARRVERCIWANSLDVLDLHLQLRLQQPPLHSLDRKAKRTMKLQMSTIGFLLLFGAASQGSSPAAGAKYVHRIESSSFKLGTGEHADVEGPYER